MTLTGTPDWTPSPFALTTRRWHEADDDHPTIVLVEHPTAPYVEVLAGEDERSLFACAHRYLARVDGLASLALPRPWLAALSPTATSTREFSWLPIDEGTPGILPSQLNSLRVRRQNRVGGVERTAVLIGGERCDDIVLGSEFGVRVVAHLRDDGPGRVVVRIAGMSASLPFGPYWTGGWNLDNPARALFSALLGARSTVALSLGFYEESVFFRSFRIGRDDKPDRAIEVRGRGLGNVDGWRRGVPTPYDFIASGTISADLTSLDVRMMRKSPMSASAGAGDALIFPRDPASGGGSFGRSRPSRSDEALEEFRTIDRIANKQNPKLEIAGLLEVVPTPYVRGDNPADGVKSVHLPGNGPPIRSNDFAAVSAYRNLGELFRRFDEYGISAPTYFRGAGLPIRAAYRSGIRPGPGKDGNTINACVTPEGWPHDATMNRNPADRPILSVHFALADRSRRSRKPPTATGASAAEPLGIAADARWAWHEIGHVLLMAAVGELEFRFAHSCGDALAAISADPASELALDSAWRGMTFPWVFIPRRHDRSVLQGWSWSGSLNQMLASTPDIRRLRRKGYWTEQILSSSLFRLYRAIGGDTCRAGSHQPHRGEREAASHYAIYLIIKALGLLGDARLVPAARPEQFVAALIDADVGTGSFTIPVTDGGAQTDRERIGGCCHKAIRWAFEAQGMYGAATGFGGNAPGLAPEVDIYVADRRPRAETTGFATAPHGPGSYVPVSLDWGIYEAAGAQGGPQAPGALQEAGIPAWFAAGEAIEIVGDQAYVVVGNRGRAAAEDVQVTLWSVPWADGARPPLWGIADWTSSDPSAPQAVTPGQPVRFGPFPVPGGDRRILVAQATCPADRANTDPLQVLGGAISGTGLACSQSETPLPDLVAGDNNLGLIVVSG